MYEEPSTPGQPSYVLLSRLIDFGNRAGSSTG